MSGHGQESVGWARARALAAASTVLQPAVDRGLAEAEGCVAAEAVRAPRPLPHYDSSAMDGWAVRGPGPWALGETAAAIVTGALVPEWCEAVVPSEEGVLHEGVLSARAAPSPGRHIRRAGDEAGAGTVLVDAGLRLRPSHLALLAVAGLDSALVRPRPGVSLLFTGDEVDTAGAPAPGRVRDAFTPLLPPLVQRLGGVVDSLSRLGDDEEAIARAIRSAASPIVVTTGGTGRSRADAVRRAIAGSGGWTVVDGVAMRPGHPTLVSALPGGRLLIALPGNPLAAVLSALSFLPPALDAASGASEARLDTGVLGEAMGRAAVTTLVPVRRENGVWWPSAGIRSHMLTGLAASAAVAVVPPGGAEAGGSVPLLPLPW